jgi:hypothetical protein
MTSTKRIRDGWWMASVAIVSVVSAAMSGRACVSNEKGNENMRRWQLRKLREAGLDTYMRATWQEAQAAIAQQSKPVISAQPTQQFTPVIDAQPAKPRGGKPGTCAWCGKSFPQALHFHVKRCKERLKLEAAT